MKRLFFLMFLCLPLALMAQGTVEGYITDAETTEALIGANVILDGTTQGTSTDVDGFFRIPNVAAGTYNLTVTYTGYEILSQPITVGTGTTKLNIALNAVSTSLEALEVFASRAVDRVTPVAYSSVNKAQIQNQLGGRDIPLVLNTAPAVYATAQGGGAGDARINVRGFNQRNVAIMINGVPVNDMENGWVYWSNWDGISDATNSVQLQRGLSAVNLATPSIGGTLNILTDPAANRSGLTFRQEFGNDGFLKSTVTASTGLVNGKYALTVSGVRKTGDGLINSTWTDAWAYYIGAGWNINNNNRLDFYALGAPQRHGQNLYKQNIAAYSHEFAREVFPQDVLNRDTDNNGTADVFDKFPEASAGRFYNQNWAPVSSSYSGQQWTGNSVQDRYDPNFLNERENFFHKPLASLNWYSNLNEKALLSTVAYYSGGEGGGTGLLGSTQWNFNSPSRLPDWDATVAANQANANGSRGILRNSRNNQWTVGAISKLNYEFSSNLEAVVGVDWRTASIDHYREVRDLLGGAYYECVSANRCNASDFWSGNDFQRGLGDKIHYDFTNTVDWLGVFAQAEYKKDALSTYGMFGYSNISYTHENFFLRDASTGNAVFTESGGIGGYQFKGGALYNVSEQVGLFGNAGYISKVPIFDGVISDGDGSLNPDPENEKFLSLEAGVQFNSTNGQFAARANVYSTQWQDRTIVRGILLADGSDALINLNGLNQRHSGFEVELAYQPSSLLRFDGSISIGNWVYTDDVAATYRPDRSSPATQEFNLFIKDLKVGDAPQTQFAYVVSLFPTRGLNAQVVGKTFMNHYADFDPLGRNDAADRNQSWKAPNYTIFDIHVNYDLPQSFVPAQVRLFANVFNIFDKIYVQDAVDNSRFNRFSDDDGAGDFGHQADDAEVFLGLPRMVNFGLRFIF